MPGGAHRRGSSLSLPPCRGTRPGVAPRGIGEGAYGEEKVLMDAEEARTIGLGAVACPRRSGQVAAGDRRAGRDEQVTPEPDRAR